MSIFQMSKVWTMQNLEPGEKLVLLAVADFADDEGRAWPSIPTLAKKSSLSEDTVRRKLRKLVHAGTLTMVPRKDKTGRDTSYNFYLFPREGEGSTLLGGGLHPARGEGSTVLPSYLNHHIEPSKNTNSDFFESLWKTYPNKEGRKPAMKHFLGTVKNESDRQHIHQALENYLAMLKKNPWRMAMGGSRWFNTWRDWVDWTPQTEIPADKTLHQKTSALSDLREKGLPV